MCQLGAYGWNSVVCVPMPSMPQIRGFCLLLPLHSQLHLAPSPLRNLPCISMSSLEILPSHPEGIPWQSGDWDSALSLLTAPGWSLVGELGSHRLSGMAKKRKGCAAESLLVQAALTPRPSHVPPYPHPLKATWESHVGTWRHVPQPHTL